MFPRDTRIPSQRGANDEKEVHIDRAIGSCSNYRDPCSITAPCAADGNATRQEDELPQQCGQFLIAEGIYNTDNDGHIVLSQCYRWGAPEKKLGTWSTYLPQVREEFGDLDGILTCPSCTEAPYGGSSYGRNSMVTDVTDGDGYYVQFLQTVEWPRAHRLQYPGELLSWICSDSAKADIWSWKPGPLHDNLTTTVAGDFDGHAGSDKITCFLTSGGLPWAE